MYKTIITSRINSQKIEEKLNAKMGEIEDDIIYYLTAVGEQCVKIAREDHPNNWGDVTGNLRSSIGYIVIKDGAEVVPFQEQLYAGKKGDGSKGAATAKMLLNKLQASYPKGIVLIVCAGMNYASYVENIHHKDVLTTAELLMNQLVKEIKKDLLNNA